MSDIRTFVDGIFDELVAIRRDIHAHPETGMRETRTAALIRSELEKMGVDEIQQPLPTAVVALFHGKKGAGKCVALRADIDALPVHEETGLPFASETEGVMHACGHDLHTTMLLGAAKTLCHMRDQFAGTVKLIFEPSEDLMPGGARALVAAGVMENPHVDAIFGQHVCPSESDSVGRMQRYKGYFTSAVDLFHIAVHGKSGHGSAPHTARDAIACAGYLITVLQTVVSRRIDPMDTAVLTVGTMSGGDAVNITAGEARMVAVLRSFSDTGRDTAIQEVRRICKGVGIAFDCNIEVELEEGYALQYNDPAMIELVDKAGEPKARSGGTNMNRENKRKTFEKGYYKTHACRDAFTCKVCGRLCTPESAGSDHRNHCPNCLSSLHVDIEPGDRASDCGGIMELVAVWVRRGGEWAIIHRCKRCGALSSNRVAADDNPMKLMSIAMRPLCEPPFPLERIEEMTALMGGDGSLKA